MPSSLALLPSELLLEIFTYFDYRGLINVRHTCKALCAITKSRQLWSNLAYDLCSKSDIGSLNYQLGNYTTAELMRWTLRRIRTRDQWASENVSQPLQFRSQLIDGGLSLSGAQLLRGGRWLFTARYDGTTYIQDLDQDDPKPQFLFQASGEEDPTEFEIWIDETNLELSLLVVMYSPVTYDKDQDQLCIHQVNFVGEGSSPLVKLVTGIPDYPRRITRYSVALSDKFFSQCFKRLFLHGEAIPDQNVNVLQLRRYSQDSPTVAEHFVEKHIECLGPLNTFFLPGDRLGLGTNDFIEIYAISSDQDAEIPPVLTTLHHLPVSQTSTLSMPFFGSRCSYLIGIHESENTFKRITVHLDHTLPPTVQGLGNSGPLDAVAGINFGPSASIKYHPSKRQFEIFTYECRVDQAHFQRKSYQIPNSYTVTSLVAFDDSIGRIVFGTTAARNQLLVLDLVEDACKYKDRKLQAQEANECRRRVKNQERR